MESSGVKQTFKVGDKVKCVDDNGTWEKGKKQLEEGKIYTVAGLNGSDLKFDDVLLSWSELRFVPDVPEQVKGTLSTRPVLSTDSAERKRTPIFSGVLKYFPDACEALAGSEVKLEDYPGQYLDDVIAGVFSGAPDIEAKTLGAVSALSLLEQMEEQRLETGSSAFAYKVPKDDPCLFTGLLGRFPLALAAVARVSWAGNEKHNPGQALHWAREKSQDHEDCVVRHAIDARTLTGGEYRDAAEMCWRCLAHLQLAIEASRK